MNATQGVIIVMGSALVLWLMWSAQSPFAAGATGASVIPGGTFGGTPNPSPGQPMPGPYNISPAPGVPPPNNFLPKPTVGPPSQGFAPTVGQWQWRAN